MRLQPFKLLGSSRRFSALRRQRPPLSIELLEDRRLLNVSPVTPVLTEPTVDGQVVNPADVHMETKPFSDPDAGNTHKASDFEIWTNGELVWRAYNNTGVEKLHIHLGDGTFVNSHAGRLELMANTDYKVRARHQDSSGDAATDWSAWGERLFHTSTPQPGTDIAWTVMQPGFVVESVAHDFQLPVNIAFIPNPGSSPRDPLFYVTELYGTIKVVHNDFSVSDYATNLLNFNPTGNFPGSGEQGLSGIAVDPVSGDVFASMVYSSDPLNESAAHYPKVVRFHSNDGGNTAATQTTILDMPGEEQGQSHFISNVSFGPDGKLYVHNGDGFDYTTAQNLASFRGKILRMNLDGTAVTDNPFYDAANGIAAQDYVYAYGLRNPFGGAWRAADGKHYEVENGPSVDRFAKIERRANYGWNDTNESMKIGALYNWMDAVAPVNVAFVQSETFAGSGFPSSMLGHAFVTQSGPTWASGPQPNSKEITEFVLDSLGNRLSGPTALLKYTGTGKASVAALAAGPNGLYFSDLYKDQNYQTPIDRGSNILRLRYVGTSMPAPNLDAVIVSSNQINLTWQDNASDEQGIKIQRKIHSYGDWQMLAVLNGANITSYEDTTVAPDATYYYRIWAYNDNAASPFSNEASANTGTGDGGSGNHAPVLDTSGNPTLPTTQANVASPSATVSSILGPWVSDSDGDAPGLAVIGVGAEGTWQYSINAGASFQGFGAPSDTAARLLRGEDLIRFVPAPGFVGSSAILFRAWDQTMGSAGSTFDISAVGTGGASAFSFAQLSGSITVTQRNNAPILSAGAPNLTPITVNDMESAGDLVSSFAGPFLFDVDGGSPGIAIFAAAGSGRWQYSIDAGGNWNDLGTVNARNARLLGPSSLVRFVPDFDYTHHWVLAPKPRIVYRAWDLSSGDNGGTASLAVTGGRTAFSTAFQVARICVNSAPVLDTEAVPTLPNMTENRRITAGAAVMNFAGSAISDTGIGVIEGIAVTGVDNNNGIWQYSLDGGVTFVSLGFVSEGAARLLRAGDRIRFVPRIDFDGTATFTFRAWDRSAGMPGTSVNLDIYGTGGSSAFSADQLTATVTVTPINHAPVLAPGRQALPAVAVDDANPAAMSVDELAGAWISDIDEGALKGIAIVAATANNTGQWQFSSDGGVNWNAFGSVSSLSALLLDSSYLLRYLPNPGYTLVTAWSPRPTIVFRAWDETVGFAGTKRALGAVGGNTAFSLGAQAATVLVNDAPLLIASAPALGPIASNQTFVATIAALLGGSVLDNGSGARQGVAVIGMTTSDGGRWQYSMNGGASFVNFGSVFEQAARLLRSNDLVRYVPLAGVPGTATLSYRAWDLTHSRPGWVTDITFAGTGGHSAFSSDADTATLTIN